MEPAPRLTLPEPSRLSHQETRELIALAQSGDAAAKERLIECNLRLVMSVARRFLGRERELDDLFQVGCLGLMRAIERFDLGYEVAFSTYAVPLIIGEIQRFMREDQPIKVSRSLKSMASRVAEARERLGHTLGRSPTADEVAQHIGASREEVVAALDASLPIASLDQPLEDEEGQLVPLAERIRLDEEAFGAVEHIALRQVSEALRQDEREFVIARFFRKLSQTELAELMGCSQAHVSRMERKIRERLRRLWET